MSTGKTAVTVLVMASILSLLLASCAFGVVQDAETGEPIQGVEVRFEDSEGGTGSITTGENGLYAFDATNGDQIPAKGPTTYEISAPGYGTSIENRDVLYDDSLERVWEAQNFKLLPGSTCVGEDISLPDIATRLGGYGDMRISGFQDRDTFTMTVVEGLDNEHWASVGIDLRPDQGEITIDLSCYRYLVIRLRGEVGGEEFRIGLGRPPTDYLYDEGLTTQWQDIIFDMPKIWNVEERRKAYQIGFEIGPDWTNNAYGATIHVDGISFTNQPSVDTPSPTPTQIPTPDPAKEERNQGYAVSFFRDGQSPITGICPTLQQIREDIELIVNNQLANSIRLYGQGCNLDQVPAIAGEYGLPVYAAAWCNQNDTATDGEIQTLINVTNNNPNVQAVIVCSEVILRGERTEQEVIDFVNTVKTQVSVPVGVAETWAQWSANPNLAASVDFLLVHIHPYHDGVCVEDAADWVLARWNQLKTEYPGKVVIVGEEGWPTGGGTNQCAVPSLKNQERFMTDFLETASQNEIPFFYFELFDEAWKIVEGPQGPTWGSYFSDRTPKHCIQSVWIQ